MLHTLLAAAPFRTPFSRRGRRVGDERHLQRRQQDSERTPRAFLALNFEPSAMRAHDAECRREPEACALADTLGGEKRVENALHQVPRHTDPLVGDGYLMETPRLHPSLMPDLVGGYLAQPAAQHDAATIGHGVARIQQKINDHLL